jgi:hypothetical protein
MFRLRGSWMLSCWRLVSLCISDVVIVIGDIISSVILSLWGNIWWDVGMMMCNWKVTLH